MKDNELCRQLESKLEIYRKSNREDKKIFLNGVQIRYIHLGFYQKPVCSLAFSVLYSYLEGFAKAGILYNDLNVRKAIRYEHQIYRQVCWAIRKYKPSEDPYQDVLDDDGMPVATVSLRLLRRIIWVQAVSGATKTYDSRRPEDEYVEEPEYDEDDNSSKPITLKFLRDSTRNRQETELISNDLKQYVFEQVKKLPEKNRTVIIEYYLNGKSMPRIAREMSCSYSNVRNRLVKGLQLLRNLLIELKSERFEEDEECGVWTKSSHLKI